MAVIFAFSSRSTLVEIESDTVEKLFYKISHLVAFAILAWLWWRALSPQREASWLALFATLALTVLYAVSDEYHQSFVPGRHPNTYDVLFDASGALLMILLLRFAARWRNEFPTLDIFISM